MICVCIRAFRWMIARPSATSSVLLMPGRMICDHPRMALSGVRSSWLRVARNSSLMRLVRSASTRAACSCSSTD